MIFYWLNEAVTGLGAETGHVSESNLGDVEKTKHLLGSFGRGAYYYN